MAVDCLLVVQLVAIKTGLGRELAQRVTDPAEVWWVGIWLKVIDGKGTGIRSSPTGFALRLPPGVQAHFLELWNRAVPQAPCEPHDSPEADGSFRSTHRIRIMRAGAGIDSVDRISLGIDLVKVLIEAVDASANPHAPDGPTAPPVNADLHGFTKPARL